LTTAEVSAAQRAVHLLHAADPKIFEDPFASTLAGPELETTIRENKLPTRHTGMMAHQLARSRYVEELVVEMNPTQYVILGAGMDSFAHRNPRMTRIFEVDIREMQILKRDRLYLARVTLPWNLTYVSLELGADPLHHALTHAGFNDKDPAVFSCMGVLPYLPRTAVHNLLEDVTATGCSGSVLVFDTLDTTAFEVDDEASRLMFAAAGAVGEPILSGFRPSETLKMVEGAGMTISGVIGAREFHCRWFQGRSDGLTPWEHIYTVRAEVR